MKLERVEAKISDPILKNILRFIGIKQIRRRYEKRVEDTPHIPSCLLKMGRVVMERVVVGESCR